MCCRPKGRKSPKIEKIMGSQPIATSIRREGGYDCGRTSRARLENGFEGMMSGKGKSRLSAPGARVGLRTGTFQLVCSEATKLSPERTSTSACPHRPAPAPTPSSFPHPWPTLIVSRPRLQTLPTAPRRGRNRRGISRARRRTSASARPATTTGCRLTQTTRCPQSVRARQSTVSRAGIASSNATGSSLRFCFSTPAPFVILPRSHCLSGIVRARLASFEVCIYPLSCTPSCSPRMSKNPMRRHVASTRATSCGAPLQADLLQLDVCRQQPLRDVLA